MYRASSTAIDRGLKEIKTIDQLCKPRVSHFGWVCCPCCFSLQQNACWFDVHESGRLTLCADDLGTLPVAVGTATRGGDVALVEALGALVAHH